MCACLLSAKTYSVPTLSFTHYSFIHSLSHSLIHSLIHSFIHSLTHSQANDRNVDIGSEDGVDSMNLKLLSTRLGNEAVSEYQAPSLRHNSQQ